MESSEPVRKFRKMWIRTQQRLKYIEARKALDDLILATPSGEERNLLTDANIALLRAEEMNAKK